MELTPPLDPASDEALYLQLYRSIREDILKGRIPAGAKLPSVRKLCLRMGISRTPVALAYAQLQAEGYLTSQPRKGLYAAALDKELWKEDKLPQSSLQETGKPLVERMPAQTLPAASISSDESRGQIQVDFGYGAVDLSAFPLTRWRRLLNRTLLPEHSRVLLYGDIQGEPGLREQISSYLHQTRGVRSSPEQIVVGAGTYHSLDLLFQLLEGEVRTLASEEAVNDGIKTLFRRFGYTGDSCIPLPLEPDGIRIEALTDSGAQAVYITPSHQFPFGMILSAGKRLRLLHWAAENKAYIIENDYDGEFRYGGRPIPALQGMDRHERVIYAGTFSRALTPSFRLSYLVLPPPLLELFRQGRHSYDQLASPLFQETLRQFMNSGDLERHMRRMRIIYQNKHDVLLETVRQSFGANAQVIGAGSGLHILLRLTTGLSETELVSRATACFVSVYPASVYALDPSGSAEATVLLGFGGLSEDDIRTGIHLLAQAWLG
jgi:GntR family transcriptional regulator / MocR family aminotransferase